MFLFLMGLDKRGYQVAISLFLEKKYVMGTPSKCLGEGLLMSPGEIRKTSIILT